MREATLRGDGLGQPVSTNHPRITLTSVCGFRVLLLIDRVAELSDPLQHRRARRGA
jgi:hypothetical protein